MSVQKGKPDAPTAKPLRRNIIFTNKPNRPHSISNLVQPLLTDFSDLYYDGSCRCYLFIIKEANADEIVARTIPESPIFGFAV